MVVVREGKYVMALDRCHDNNQLFTLALNVESTADANTVFDYDPDTFGMNITANPSRTEYMVSNRGRSTPNEMGRVLNCAEWSQKVGIKWSPNGASFVGGNGPSSRRG